FIVRETEDWPDVLQSYAEMPFSERKTIGNQARNSIERDADWSVIGEKYRNVFEKLLDKNSNRLFEI
ncbi:MAG: hypothetical protein ACRDBH_10575, partial [Bosea sp. (in: a-proteobacteria)]